MSGFDNARVDQLFLDGRGWRSNFLLSIGYAVRSEAPRNPRLAFEEMLRGDLTHGRTITREAARWLSHWPGLTAYASPQP